MTVKEWTRVAREDELEEGVPFGAKLGEKDIIVVRLNGRIFACGGSSAAPAAIAHANTSRASAAPT